VTGACARLEHAPHEFRAELTTRDGLIGDSLPMRKVAQFIERVGPARATVLICGETGTGKEMVARAIHCHGPRASKRFVAINCATLSEPLLESTLFGHERGAFTGAVAMKRGIFEIANGGTVFLDEVGELSAGVQARLLRVIQEREFERVGGTVGIKVDIRLIAATNRDLKQAVVERTFREDLYFRLNVIALSMPPLRERGDDVEMLAVYFVRKHAARCQRRIAGISQEALQMLVAHEWPGNVRELENAIERAVVMTTSASIQPEDLPPDVLEAASIHKASLSLCGMLARSKRELIRSTLEQASGDYARAARQLGVHVNSLHRLITQLGLRSPSKSPADSCVATPNSPALLQPAEPVRRVGAL
jgi:two-component system response regulator HydG